EGDCNHFGEPEFTYASLHTIHCKFRFINTLKWIKQSHNHSDSGPNLLVAKRTACEEPSIAPDCKRAKRFHDGLTEPDVKTPGLAWRVPFPEKALKCQTTPLLTILKLAILEERNGEIEFRVVNNDGSRESTIILTGLNAYFKGNFRKRLRITSHVSSTTVLIYRSLSSKCLWRSLAAYHSENFETAISSDQQVKGYGAHLMGHLKDYIRATSPVMHFLTYADNHATGYFQKQGFTKEITLYKSIWKGCIKDYEGGTLMQCSMLARIRYLEVGRMLLKQKESVLAKIRTLGKNHIIHLPPQQWANANDGVVIPLDPLSIPAVRATGWSPDMDELGRDSCHGSRFKGPNFNEFRRFMNEIQNHTQAWPLLNPIDKDEYHCITNGSIDYRRKIGALHYSERPYRRKLIFSNCRQYNDATTVYTKCALKLEKCMWKLIEEIPEWSYMLEE
ncbi:hypothetical protein N7537_000848, partial [Penicillium hordei]